jgi:hypothetical protein
MIGFQRRFNEYSHRACHWNVLGPACIIGCGQSDDGFMDFRSWLISLGRETYEKVLSDPDALADIPAQDDPIEEWYFEEIAYLAPEIYEEQTGEEMPLPERDEPDEPYGETCEVTAEALSKRFPRLWSRFGDAERLVP